MGQKDFSNQEEDVPLKRMLSLCILCLVLSTSLAACDISGSPIGSSTPTATSTVSPTATTSPTSPTAQPTPTGTGSAIGTELTSIITTYYNDIEAKNYTQAYTYLDPQATNTTTGQTLTQSSFVQLAQEMDNKEGTVVSFDIGVFPPSTQITMTVMRGRMGAYHAQLDMKQEDNTWKIISLDRI